MKKQLQRFRKFFVRTKRMNASTARPAMNAYDDEDDGSTRLSSAFIVVLLLHVVAVVGVIAFTRIKENRKSSASAATAVITESTSVASIPEPQPQSQLETPPKPIAALTPAASDPKSSLPPPSAEDARPAPVATTTEHTAGRVHTVKSGENLTKIAMAYGVTTSELAATNAIKGDEMLKIGRKLDIPDKKTTAAKAIPVKKAVTETAKAPTSGHDVYVVQKGDNPVQIARDLGVSYDELRKLNNIKDPKKLQPGAKLKVPNKQG